MADTYSQLEDKEQVMCIYGCDEQVRDVLELVGITTIIDTFETGKEASNFIKQSL